MTASIGLVFAQNIEACKCDKSTLGSQLWLLEQRQESRKVIVSKSSIPLQQDVFYPAHKLVQILHLLGFILLN